MSNIHSFKQTWFKDVLPYCQVITRSIS